LKFNNDKKKENAMLLFMIPLCERFTNLRKPPVAWGKSRYVSVDGFGMLVYYDEEKDLTPENIRRYLIGLGKRRCYIDAGSLEEAVRKFHDEWEGAKVGGEGEERKALYIDKENAIIELPFCAKMGRNKKGEFICGELVEEESGEWGMCVIEGYDPPEDCPILEVFYARK
jgi:hypothetical protein